MAALRPSDGLLAQVAAYTGEAVSAVARADLSAPTPCRQWDLQALLLHLNSSLGSLIAMLRDGRAGLDAGLGAAAGRGRRSRAADLLVDDDVRALLAAAVCDRTERLVRVHDALRRGARRRTILVGGRPLAGDMVAAAGAVEIAVHSWDVSAACGRSLPIPDAPAAELLELAGQIVDGAARPGLFAAAVSPPPGSRPGDRLVALLGRAPDGSGRC